MVIHFFQQKAGKRFPLGEFGMIVVPREGERVSIHTEKKSYRGLVLEVKHIVDPPLPEVWVTITEQVTDHDGPDSDA